jgi:hypothetical protein
VNGRTNTANADAVVWFCPSALFAVLFTASAAY